LLEVEKGTERRSKMTKEVKSKVFGLEKKACYGGGRSSLGKASPCFAPPSQAYDQKVEDERGWKKGPLV